jgi:hypothetical protein
VNVSVLTPALYSGSIQLRDLSICQSDRQIEAAQCTRICCDITRMICICSDVFPAYGSIDSFVLSRYTGLYEHNFSEDVSLLRPVER